MARIFRNGIGIDARNTPKGLRFRARDGSTQSYITEEMSEQGIREFLLRHAVSETIREFLFYIDGHITRASVKGKDSAFCDDATVLDEPWDREPNKD